MLVFLAALPMAGVALAGKPVAQYLEFPPLTQYVPHAPFSWPVFVGLAAFGAVAVIPFVIRLLSPGVRQYLRGPAARPFPWWGWAGIAFGIVAWVLAWSRFSWFTPLQPFTFTPLWVSYILVVNALTYWRGSRCMMLDRPGFFALVFPVSAIFWWFFEYLNRFVQNWYYEGVSGLDPLQYFLFATLPFSTVLPAVLGTYELLNSVPRMGRGLDRFVPIRVSRPRAGAGVALFVAGAGLAAVGVWPDYLFPLVWVSPVLILSAIQVLRGRNTPLSGIQFGFWRHAVLLSLAALICGFFWEMWNFHSLARWKYAVPFVGEFRIFEMPVLGYLGYLPFGWECGLIGGMIEKATGDARRGGQGT